MRDDVTEYLFVSLIFQYRRCEGRMVFVCFRTGRNLKFDKCRCRFYQITLHIFPPGDASSHAINNLYVLFPPLSCHS